MINMINLNKLQRNCTWYIYYTNGLARLQRLSRTLVYTQKCNLHIQAENAQTNKRTGTQICTSTTNYSSYLLPCNVSYRCSISDSLQRRKSVLCTFSTPLHSRHFSEHATEVKVGLFPRIFLWMSESTPVAYAQEFLLTVHNSTGLPWWATIVVTTVFLRTVITLPLAIYQNYILAKVENLQLLEMPDIVKELKKETAIAIKQYGWTEKQARVVYNRSVKKQWTKLLIRDNCHPFKASILLWVQIPMWIFLSVSLRNLVYMLPHRDGPAMIAYMELSVGGFGWIPNLLIPDEALILPVALGLVNLAIVELQTMSKIRKDSKVQKYVTYLFRGLSLVMIPVAASVPSCLCLYWVTSSTFGLIQNMVLLSPRIKKLSRIPETPTQLENPYKHIASEIRLRASRIAGFWKFQAKD